MTVNMNGVHWTCDARTGERLHEFHDATPAEIDEKLSAAAAAAPVMATLSQELSAVEPSKPWRLPSRSTGTN